MEEGIGEAVRRYGGKAVWRYPPNNSTLSRVLAAEEHGRELFEAAQRLDLEGIVAKRKADPYSPQTVWCKVKNPAYTQAGGRGHLFERKRR